MSSYRKPQKPTHKKTKGVVVRLAEPPEDPEEEARTLARERAKLLAQHQSELERESRGAGRLTQFALFLLRHFR